MKKQSRRRHVALRISLMLGAVVFIASVALLALLFVQGRREPDRSGQYVALGSSFAAGLGLGPRDPGSPLVCMRSTNGYPQQLARLLDMHLVDMSCSGSTTEHILSGGQVFQGPQLAAVGPNTRLVTITSGGNDVGYIGDLMFKSGSAGAIGKLFLKEPAPLSERDFDKVETHFALIVQTIRRQAPDAQVVVVSYPPVLPANGTCKSLGIDAKEAALSRRVAERLHAATREAARKSGTIFVDMTAVGNGHDACAEGSWINGASPEHGAPFHPNLVGAKAMAEASRKALLPVPR